MSLSPADELRERQRLIHRPTAEHVRSITEVVRELLASVAGSVALAEIATDDEKRTDHLESATIAVSAACDRLRRLESQLHAHARGPR